jgi:hypothetical protein
MLGGQERAQIDALSESVLPLQLRYGDGEDRLDKLDLDYLDLESRGGG